MKVIAFAASTSTKSINRKLANYSANLIDGAQIELLDLNDYDLPMYSEDIERDLLATSGPPKAATDFRAKLASADAIIVSFAEHNGSYTAAFKNLFDWCTRQGRDVYAEKPMVLLSTSKGPRGAKTVLEFAANSIPRFSGDIKASVSVPSFYDNYDFDSEKITNSEINDKLKDAVLTLTT
ncbi:MAG: NAD(P)H-dependent oxidoreductase [Acidiferrobacterales bacterium]|nr:NAD(P)H-dependent oxidoreductase [Acidiferrobacterales bacterium]